VTLTELPALHPPGTLRLIRRSGHVVAWNERKIELAVAKAFASRGLAEDDAAPLAARVTDRARELGQVYVPIETVQDLVQEELVLGGHMRVAESYIVYRAERARLRAQDTAPPVPATPIGIVEPDGTEHAWTGADLRRRIAFASIGLDLDLGAGEIERELRRSIHTGGARAALVRTIVHNA
jgi:ribonucleoside-diphosphate reductase alpha chain